MGERDWLTELTSAFGDDGAPERGLTVVPDPAPPADDDPAPHVQQAPDSPPPPAPVASPAPPAVDPELDLMGPGRPLEGWAEELASAFAEDDDDPEADDPDADEAGGDGLPGGWTAPVADNVLRFDALVADRLPTRTDLDEASVSAAVEVAVAVAAADIAAGVAAESSETAARIAATEARLERIESLLTADLSQLGPAVLADSVGDLETRLEALRDAVGAVTERVQAIPVPDPDDLALQAPVDGTELGELRALLDRLTDRVAAQARFLAAHADTVSADAHQRDDLLRAILAKLDAGR